MAEFLTLDEVLEAIKQRKKSMLAINDCYTDDGKELFYDGGAFLTLDFLKHDLEKKFKNRGEN